MARTFLGWISWIFLWIPGVWGISGHLWRAETSRILNRFLFFDMRWKHTIPIRSFPEYFVSKSLVMELIFTKMSLYRLDMPLGPGYLPFWERPRGNFLRSTLPRAPGKSSNNCCLTTISISDKVFGDWDTSQRVISASKYHSSNCDFWAELGELTEAAL